MTDPYTPYETGLQDLLTRLGAAHPHYNTALVYRQRLMENLSAARAYGDTRDREAARAEILDRLEALTQETLGVAFYTLCPALPTAPSPASGRGHPAPPQINLSGTFTGPVSVNGDAIDLRGSQGAVINPSGPVTQTFGSAPVPASSPPVDPAVRARLSRLDDVQLDTLCLDHFPEVYDQFSRGLRRDEKLNMLVAYIRHHPETASRL